MSAPTHTTVSMEAIGTLVRTTRDHGGFLVAEFRDQHGTQHSDEAKANAQLFVAASELLEGLQFAIRFFDQLTPADAERMRAIVAKATRLDPQPSAKAAERQA